MALAGKQRKFLRGLAHGLEPVVQVGRAGVSEALVQATDEALEIHELIKVRFVDCKGQKKALTAELAGRLDCDQVGMIGHVAILFRPARNPASRRIDLPA